MNDQEKQIMKNELKNIVAVYKNSEDDLIEHLLLRINLEKALSKSEGRIEVMDEWMESLKS